MTNKEENNLNKALNWLMSNSEDASDRYINHEKAIEKYLEISWYKRLFFDYKYWNDYFINLYKD